MRFQSLLVYYIEYQNMTHGDYEVNVLLIIDKGIKTKPKSNSHVSQLEIDLIITDYHMCQINGLELAESVKKLDEYKNTDIVLYTNATDLAVMTNRRFDIFDKVLYKTNDINNFIEEINILLFSKINSNT